ncbi:MAG: imidazoleglycerol-phosphate dehydratase HisB [Armatimonadetes bacterium]|nr:imidazoleglycerol-phosphate dehydratase HisB [Armatimonadota bacterium]
MKPKPRRATIERRTGETDIHLELDLDGTGQHDINTGVGFLDHMLAQIARHGQVDLTLRARGDVHIDFHHTAEDTGIVLGEAIRQALGDKAGVTRYGSALIPLDEALVQCALDLSGRPFLSYDVPVSGKVGEFDAELALEIFRAIAFNAAVTLHLTALAGENTHHLIEAAFKAFARALRAAKAVEQGSTEVPSTKGVL